MDNTENLSKGILIILDLPLGLMYIMSFEWNECRQAFELLKDKLTTPAILT